MARLDQRAESCGMDIDAGRVTETLAARLAAIVPDGFHHPAERRGHAAKAYTAWTLNAPPVMQSPWAPTRR
jgi:hypothetical protein